MAAEPGEAGSPELELRFVGAWPGALAGEGALRERSSLYLGQDPSRWGEGLANFRRLRAPGLYPGVDLLLRASDQGELEFDLLLDPGRDSRQVRLACGSGAHFELGKDGALLVGSRRTQRLRLPLPQLYQPVPGGMQPVRGGYRLLGPRELGFWVGSHDPALPLVIDPLLVSASVFGGTGNNRIVDLKMTPTGHTLMLIMTNAANFPTKNPAQAAAGGGYDGVLLMVDPSGALEWSTYFGGSGDENPSRMALATDGSIYVVGSTTSTNLPTLNPLQGTYGGGQQDGFIMHFSATGTLLSSTYLGGGSLDRLTCCDLDAAGNLYVGGWSYSKAPSAFPTQNPIQASNRGNVNGVLLCTNPAVSSLVFSTYLGGTWADYINAVAAIPGGGCYFTGQSFSTDFPTATPYQAARKGSCDAMFGRVSAAGALQRSSYFGGSGDNESGNALALDLKGNLWLGCVVTSTDVPVLNPIQATYGGGVNDIHLSLWDPDLTSPLFATYYGGSDSDSVAALAVTSRGELLVAGFTQSANLLLPGADRPYQGQGDGLLLRLDPAAGAYPLAGASLSGMPVPLTFTLGYGTCQGHDTGLDWLTSVATDGTVMVAGGSGWTLTQNPFSWATPGPAENCMFGRFRVRDCADPSFSWVVSAWDANQQVPPGATVDINATVVSGGTPPFQFQWYRNGVPIAGATSLSVHLGVFCPQDDGAVIELRYSDACGKSGTRLITIKMAPEAPSIPPFAPATVGILDGVTASYTVPVLGTCNPAIQVSLPMGTAFQPVVSGSSFTLTPTVPASGPFNLNVQVGTLAMPVATRSFTANIHGVPGTLGEGLKFLLDTQGNVGNAQAGPGLDHNGDGVTDRKDVNPAVIRLGARLNW